MLESFQLVADAISFAKDNHSQNGDLSDATPDAIPGRILCWKFYELVVERFGSDSLNELRRLGLSSTSQIGSIVERLQEPPEGMIANDWVSEPRKEYNEVFEFDTVFGLGGLAEIELCERQCLEKAGRLIENGGHFLPQLRDLLCKVFQFVTRLDDSTSAWRLAGKQLLSAITASLHQQSNAYQIVEAVFDEILPSYLTFHEGNLLRPLDHIIFNPFFVGKAIQLAADNFQSPCDVSSLTQKVISGLNQTIARRPVAVINGETKQPHAKEFFGTVPLYIRGQGFAPGRFREIVQVSISILQDLDSDIGNNMLFDQEYLNELAMDWRTKCFKHPIYNSGNFHWGYWDTDSIGSEGYFQRYVAHRECLESLVGYVDSSPPEEWNERVYEAGVVFAALILMASSVSGNKPNTRILRETINVANSRTEHSRDIFYQRHAADELQNSKRQNNTNRELGTPKRPFGNTREFVNRYSAIIRKRQDVYRDVAEIALNVGNLEQARKYSIRSESPESYWTIRVISKQKKAQRHYKSMEYSKALKFSKECIEDLHAGIRCGAFVDPWVITHFKGMHNTLKSSVVDNRCEHLIEIVRSILQMLSQFRCGLADQEDEVAIEFEKLLEKLAHWWDEFDTIQAEDLNSFRAQEILDSAQEVTRLVGSIRCGDSPIDTLALSTDQSFSQALKQIRYSDVKHFVRVAEAWLAQSSDDVAGLNSCISQINSWLQEYFNSHQQVDDHPEGSTVVSFLVRTLESLCSDGRSFEWTHNDGGLNQGLGDLLNHQILVVRFLIIGSSAFKPLMGENSPENSAALDPIKKVFKLWLRFAQRFLLEIQTIFNAVAADIQQILIDVNVADPDSRRQFDQKRIFYDELVDQVISSAVEVRGFVQIVMTQVLLLNEIQPPNESTEASLIYAIATGNKEDAKRLSNQLIVEMSSQPMLYIPLSRGGNPLAMMEVYHRQHLVKFLLICLPRMGLLLETLQLIDLVRVSEKQNAVGIGAVTEFDYMFQIGFDEIVANTINASRSISDEELFLKLEVLVEQALKLWLVHAKTLRLSVLEKVADDDQWNGLVAFIKRYGDDFISRDFLRSDNIRSILRLGVGNWLASLEENPRGEWEYLLLDEIDAEFSREKIIDYTTFILEAVIENWTAYNDFLWSNAWNEANFAESIRKLLAFLRLKASYKRIEWHLQPIYRVHFMLLKHRRDGVADRWLRSTADRIKDKSKEYEEQLRALKELWQLLVSSIEELISEGFLETFEINRLRYLAKISSGHELSDSDNSPKQLDALIDEKINKQVSAGKSMTGWVLAVTEEINESKNKRFNPLKTACDFLVQEEELSSEEIDLQIEMISRYIVEHVD